MSRLTWAADAGTACANQRSRTASREPCIRQVASMLPRRPTASSTRSRAIAGRRELRAERVLIRQRADNYATSKAGRPPLTGAVLVMAAPTCLQSRTQGNPGAAYTSRARVRGRSCGVRDGRPRGAATPLRGAFPVLPTPLDATGGLDLQSLRSLVERLQRSPDLRPDRAWQRRRAAVPDLNLHERAPAATRSG